MAIYRAPRPESDYAQIRNDVLRDERLSYRARGILATILSHTDEWQTSAESLARAGQEGRDAIRTALSELEAAGYLRREKRQDAQGRWSTQAIVYDTPRPTAVQDTLLDLAGPPTPENPSSVGNAQVTDISAGQTGDGKPAVGFSGANRTPSRTLPVPTEPGDATERDLKAEGHAIATALYEAANGMIPFMGMKAIATAALKMPGSPSPADVQAAMLGLYAEGRSITKTTLGQRLNRQAAPSQTAVSNWEGRSTW